MAVDSGRGSLGTRSPQFFVVPIILPCYVNPTPSYLAMLMSFNDPRASAATGGKVSYRHLIIYVVIT